MKCTDPVFDNIDEGDAEPLFFAAFNRFEVAMPWECVEDCSHQGSCDGDVAHWKPILKLEIDPIELAKELQEYGAWDAEELADHENNLDRIIWIAACNIKEEAAEGE